MRQRSWLGALGVLFLASFGACTNEPVFNAAVIDGNFVAPVADFDPVLDAAMWDDTSYDAVVVTTAVAQVTAVPAANRLPRPIGPLLASFGAVIPSSCIPAVTFTDGDQDGIPASYTATFNCLGVPAGTSRVTGRVTITDNDDSSATAGLTVAFSSFVIAAATSGGVVVGRTFEGTMALAPGPGGTFTVTQNLTTTFPSADVSTVQLLDTYVSQENASYTPDPGAVDPFSSGTVNLGGTGKLTATFNGDQQHKDISRSSNPLLHWNSACRTQVKGSIGYDSGTLIYSIGGDGKLDLLFSGCVAPVRAVGKN